MPTDVSSLTIRVSTEGATKAAREMDGLTAAGTKAEASTIGLGSATAGLRGELAELLGPLTALFAINELVRTYTAAARSSDLMSASLRTFTGEARLATEAGEALHDLIVGKMIHGDDDVTAAFVNLANRGLDTSRRSLLALGDTATAFQKTMSDLADTVGRATAGEFRGLHELGISVQDQGARLVFISRGVATEVNNDAKSIQEYLVRMGETRFAGAMDRELNTIHGATKKLRDTWEDLFQTIHEQGFDSSVVDGLRAVRAELEMLNDDISSGATAARLRAFSSLFADWQDDAVESIAQVSGAFGVGSKDWSGMAGQALRDIGTGFVALPVYIRSSVQLIASYIYSWWTDAKAGGTAIKDFYLATFDFLVDGWAAVGHALRDAFDPSKSGTFTKFQGEASEANLKYLTTVEQIVKTTADAHSLANQAHAENVADILAERDAVVDSFFDQQSAANKLRREFKATRDEREAAIANGATPDPLAKFTVTGNVSNEFLTRLKATKDALRDEFQVEREAYDLQLSTLNEAHEKTLLSDADFYALRERATVVHEEKLTQILRSQTEVRRALQKTVQDAFFNTASQAASAIESMTERGSAMQKAAFAVGKAIAIAQTIVNTEAAAAAAVAPPPLGLGPAAGAAYATSIRAMGYASAAVIAATGIAELRTHDHGGMVPAGVIGIAGENGAELIRGPALVTSTRTTAASGATRHEAAVLNVNVHNYAPGVEVAAEEHQTPAGKVVDVIVRRVKDALARDVSTGGAPWTTALERTYGLGRGLA